MVMRNFRKRGSIFLVAVLVIVTALAGCSKKEPKVDEKQGTDSTSQKKPEITVTIYDNGQIPADEGNAEENRWTKWLNENGPVNVKYIPIPRTESKQKLNMLFASGSAPDLVLEFDTVFRNELYAQKQIMPIGDLIEKNSTVYKNLMQKYPELKKIGTKPDGKLYEVGRVNDLRTGHGLLIRTDWLKKLNLEMPKTVDELFNVIKAFTANDPDGNGKNDTFGINLSYVGGMAIDQIFGAANWVVKDGQLLLDWDRVEAAYTFKKKLFDAGVVDKDFLTDKNGQKAKQDWINGKLGIYGVGVPSVVDIEAFRKNNPNAELQHLVFPKTEFGQFNGMFTNPLQMTGVVNASAKDPVAVIKYIDFMASDLVVKTLKFGLEGTHYKMDEKGLPKIIDSDKYKKEVSWNNYYMMLCSNALLGKQGLPEILAAQTTAADKEFVELTKGYKKVYFDKSRKASVTIHQEHMPTMPQELQLIQTNIGDISETYAKGIVGGASYSAKQAVQDARNTWEKSGGKQIEDFMKKWHAEGKSTLMEDLYKYVISAY